MHLSLMHNKRNSKKVPILQAAANCASSKSKMHSQAFHTLMLQQQSSSCSGTDSSDSGAAATAATAATAAVASAVSRGCLDGRSEP
jgi:hypothetical protein